VQFYAGGNRPRIAGGPPFVRLGHDGLRVDFRGSSPNNDCHWDREPILDRKEQTMTESLVTRPDTSDMAAVHKVFRSSLASAPSSLPACRATSAGNSWPTTTRM
jgi:hypothetical protein